MDIGTLEQRYQNIRADFQAGRINAVTFAAEVDHLSFQDREGRYWMLGAQSGSWYYYDGLAWHPADPRQSGRPPLGAIAASQPPVGRWERPPERFPAAPLVMMPLKMMGLIGLAFLVVLTLLTWPVSSAPPLGGPVVAPSPRPPVQPVDPDGGDGNDDRDDGDSGSGRGSGPHSAIFGNIVDLSTDRPGAGLEVAVNGAIVRSNTEGFYSITGLGAGEYEVTLALADEGVTAHGPIAVSLDGRNPVTVDLAYYTQAPIIPTDTPQPPAVVSSEPPPSLPDSGAPRSSRAPLFMMIGGLLLALVGGSLYRWQDLPEQDYLGEKTY